MLKTSGLHYPFLCHTFVITCKLCRCVYISTGGRRQWWRQYYLCFVFTRTRNCSECLNWWRWPVCIVLSSNLGVCLVIDNVFKYVYYICHQFYETDFRGLCSIYNVGVLNSLSIRFKVLFINTFFIWDYTFLVASVSCTANGMECLAYFLH